MRNNCAGLSRDEIKSLAEARGWSAFGCAVAFGILCVWIFWKWFRNGHKKLTTKERLFIYVAIGTFLPLIGFAIHGFEHIHHYDDDDTTTLCEVSAYLVQSFEWTQLLIFSGVVITLLVITCHQRGKCTCPSSCFNRCSLVTMSCTACVVCEIVLMVITIVVSFLINIIPYVKHDYGEAGPWCWIRSKNPRHDCTNNDSGFWEQIFLWYVEFAAISVLCIILTVVTLCYTCCKKPMEETEVEEEGGDGAEGEEVEGEAAAKCSNNNCKTVGLLFYLSVSFFMGGVEMTARIIDRTTSDKNYGLWMGYAILTPASKIILPVMIVAVYLGCFNNLCQIPKRNIKRKQYTKIQ